MTKRPTVLQSVAPVLTLMGLIGLNVALLGDDTLSGANQLSLLSAAAVAALIAVRNGVRWNDIMQNILHTLNASMPAVLILLMIGILAGTWMLSGIIPAMIHYGLYILRPDYFLPAAVVISSLISVATGSSWSTIATVGVALLGIGETLGFDEAVVAGAIISGAYFGDKISPLSDTTNLASATTGTDLFVHIRYMMYTTVPSILVTLIVFLVISLCGDHASANASAVQVQEAIAAHYRITPVLFLVPIAVIVMIVRKVPPLPALFIGGVLGAAAALIFQPGIIRSLSGTDDPTAGEVYRVITRSMYGTTAPTTGNPVIDDLFTTRGMAGMLHTVWLIVTAMVFGGVMEAGRFLERITNALIRRVHRPGGVVTTTAATCILFNLTTSDQYISIVVPGKMFNRAYRKSGLAPEVLSRTLEDSGTVTSVLIPWNSCGATQSGVLGVATAAYLPYAVFCYVSPLASVLAAWLNFKIRRNTPPEETKKRNI